MENPAFSRSLAMSLIPRSEDVVTISLSFGHVEFLIAPVQENLRLIQRVAGCSIR